LEPIVAESGVPSLVNPAINLFNTGSPPIRLLLLSLV
jgi:hypothetical protein